jgi:hypothetical protein
MVSVSGQKVRDLASALVPIGAGIWCVAQSPGIPADLVVLGPDRQCWAVPESRPLSQIRDITAISGAGSPC